MPNLDELRREAEETKERLRRDILEFRDVLKRVAREACPVPRNGGGDRERTVAEESLRLAETQLEQAISQAEKRFEQALAAVTRCNISYDDFVTRKLDLADFTNVEVDCAFHLEIEKADTYRVAIWASEELQEQVNAARSGNTLKLSLKSSSFRARPVVQAKIGMPHLSRLRLGGASRGTVRGFASKENLGLNLSGNSYLEADMGAGTTKCEISGASRLTGKLDLSATAEFVLSGASRVEIAGAAKSLSISAWGASKAEMDKFAATDAAVNLKGASEGAVNVTGQLDVDLSSGSRLTYAGSPAIRAISVTGASSLNHRG